MGESMAGMAGREDMVETTAQSGEGYGMDTWNYKIVGAPESDMIRVLEQEGANGWECLGLTVRQSVAGEYLMLFRSKKSMMGM